MAEKTTWTEKEMQEGFMPGMVMASDGKPIRFSRKVPGGGSYGAPIPVMDCDESRADTTITVGKWELSYDSRGYCYKRVKK